MLHLLETPPEDALHAVMDRYNADPRPARIDLGVGVYREADGRSPIMDCIAVAQTRLLEEETSKSYLPLKGNEEFLAGMAELVFDGRLSDRCAALQCVGGTGAVRLGVELAAKANPGLSVHVGLPTWPNHLNICERLRVPCKTWQYFDVAIQQVDMEATASALEQANRGDVFILHGPCHNPTGADLSSEQLLSLVTRAGQLGVIPLIDAAYYGLGNALDDDLKLLAACVEQAPEVLLVMSCSKAFGLYRERTGVLFAATQSTATAHKVQGTLEYLARGNYSMPPSHGAAVVGKLLSDASLNAQWRTELAGMRERIASVRHELAAAATELPLLGALQQQKGIFSLLALDESQVTELAREAAIYLPASGRINLAGFKTGDVARFTAALARMR